MNEQDKQKQENQTWTSAYTLTPEQFKKLVADKLARAQAEQIIQRKLTKIT